MRTSIDGVSKPMVYKVSAPKISSQIRHELGLLKERPGLVYKKKTVLKSRLFNRKHPAFAIMVLLMFASFSAGMVTVWETQFSRAEIEPKQSEQVAGLVTTLDPADGEPNIIADLLPLLIEQNRHEPTPEEIASRERKDKLRNYLASKKSPLAEDEAALDAFLASNNMEMMLAISFVEGNFCKHHYYFNCSGIGGNNIRKYKNFSEWIASFDSLLERKYKGLAVEDYIGYYVVPGTENWKRGVYQILEELKQGGIK